MCWYDVKEKYLLCSCLWTKEQKIIFIPNHKTIKYVQTEQFEALIKIIQISTDFYINIFLWVYFSSSKQAIREN